MLTLAPGCSCDVCAEEYGPHRPPHSIPCGHVFCAKCCQTIVEKTNARHAPACPFCREPFTADSARLIRMDFPTSGWSTPRRFPAIDSFNTTFNTEVFQRKTERLAREGGSRAQLQVRRLEDSVSRIAAKKCSVEEVSQLYKELEEFLIQEKDDPTTSLFLSAALLRAILMNHLAHSEASKSAKTAEANLKAKIDELDHSNGKLESELRRQRTLYAEKSQECQQLRQELSQFRALSSIGGYSSGASSGTVTPDSQSPRSMSPVPPSTSPTPYSSASAQARAQSQAQTPLSRFSSMHARSASMSSRPNTPASPARSHTPASPSVAFPSSSSASAALRSHTPGPTSPRSHTPGPSSSASAAAGLGGSPLRSHTPSLRAGTPGIRPYTPGPLSPSHSHSSSFSTSSSTSAIPPVPAIPRFSTPAPGQFSSSASASAQAQAAARAQTPAPMIPPKPRRLSQPSPPKMMARSTSEEKADAHERWIPPQVQGGYGNSGVINEDYLASKERSKATRPPSRAASIASRFRDIF